jgi:hypothetical protein
VAFLRQKQIKIKGKTNWRDDIHVVPATGGTPEKVAISDSIHRFAGWRATDG